MNRPAIVRIAFALLLVGRALAAAEPEVDLRELPRFPPVEPAEALATFVVKPGFRVELVAAEPLVRDPIEICFDENGRLFAVEMIDYSELRDAKPHLGRIRLLEDTDGDGRMDRSRVFVDDLPWPTGVFWANGGLFVAATPDVFFCRDTDGDGKAESRELAFTGFAIDYAPYATNQLNMQAMVNSFRWGLDNRIHGCTAPNGGEITSPRWPAGRSVNVRGRDFAFDPRTWEMVAEAGGGQYGLAFDDRGRRFTCNNSDHLRVFQYDARYAARNPYFDMPPVLQSIAVDGPAAEVFRTSPEEPWRVIRTRWRVSGAVPGLIEGGGRASGYFTSATGVTIYRGDAWPEEFVGDAFTADCGSNLIHRKKLRQDGVVLRAERPAEEQRVEFLTSRDTWFRPVQLVNGPDGALYIVDMYREIIEHPWSLPPALKKHLDLNAGNDRGRIYRVVPTGFKPPARPRLGEAGTAELVAALGHRNAWHRETAARLIYERPDRAAIPALERLLGDAASPLGRLHALYALAGLGALRQEHLQRALDDTDDRVREHAVKLSEPFLASAGATHPLPARLLAMTGDSSPLVRYQVAFTLGECRGPERIQGLEDLAVRDGGDPWMRAAILSSLADGAGELFQRLARRSGGQPVAAPEFLRDLVRVIGARNQSNEVAAVLDHVARTPDPAAAFALVHGLAEGLRRARASLAAERIQPILERARVLARDSQQPERDRVRAVELLALTRFEEAGVLLLSLLTPETPQPIQLAALETLGRLSGPELATALVARWPAFTPRLREAAVAVLLGRPERLPALLGAVESGVIRRTDLTSVQIDQLTNHRDEAIRGRAVRLLTAAGAGSREEVLAAYEPALTLAGDAARGRQVFQERCASCHRLGGEGWLVGPDLVSVRNAGKDKLLSNLIDPSRELLPQYVAYEVETKDDESVLGVLVNETATAVTLRQAYGKETVIPRTSIAAMRSTGKSLMPDELEAGLDPQGVADLLEYIGTAEK
ncbi:MAG: c-type cytochrome [Verrucomicrobia bacterium]|nr:c-type cytochrome [Verrucomicrobiota bacterium]